MAFYGKKEYWDERYTRATEPYEWYQSYHGICHLLTPFHLTASTGVNPAKPRRILETFASSSQRQGDTPSFSHQHDQQQAHIPPRKDCRVLVVGCGNSRLAEDMVRDGWTGGIVGVDWSPVVIDQMEAKYSPEYLQRILMDESMRHGRNASNRSCSHPLLEFHCANVLECLPFNDGTFDLILCKGSFDAVRVVLSFFENPNDEWWSEVGIHTLAKPITDPRRLLENLDGPKFHYAYICRKRASEKLGRLVETETLMRSSSDEENNPLVNQP
ncbi:methyltransferase [Fragilaria crotonensis]|nr:methyltransferase [Fragilaria crotonensis]